jgi:hypothetical protein
MRTLTTNEIEEVGGGPAWFAPPLLIKCLKWGGGLFAAAVVVGAGEEAGSQAVKKITDTCGPDDE